MRKKRVTYLIATLLLMLTVMAFSGYSYEPGQPGDGNGTDTQSQTDTNTDAQTQTDTDTDIQIQNACDEPESWEVPSVEQVVGDGSA
jgi:hypothetical protein